MAIYSLDCETYKYDKSSGNYKPILNAQSFSLGCIKSDSGTTKFFYTRDGMKDFIQKECERMNKNKKRTFWYAHNHSYDFYSIWKDDLLNPKIKHICENPFIAIYDEKNYFLDTMSFYRMSLRDVGNILNYPKMEMPMEITSLEQLKPYLERDTDIVLKSVINLKEQIKTLGFNPRKLMTAGQLAITSFLTYCRRNGTDKEFTEYNPIKRIRQVVKSQYPKLVRRAFRGGMNQCFKIGRFDDVTLVDVNGSYAYMMTIMDFPDLKSETYLEKVSIGMLKAYLEESIGVAGIKIRSPKMELPFLPIRFLRYTIYPSDRVMRGTWTFEEIRRAVEMGYEIIECEWCIKWKKARNNPLKSFIEQIYSEEKIKRTKMEKIPLKLIRNNLYGKFAQYRTNKDYKIVLRYKARDLLMQGYIPISSIGDKYICAKEMDEYIPSYVNPIISAMITANARIFLYDKLCEIPKEDRLYCDTDGIVFKGNHLDKFDIGKELGQWEVEGKGDAKFLGEKRYYIDETIKISGLMRRERNKEIIDNEQDVETKRIIGLKKGIKEGRLDEVGTFEPHIHEMSPHNKLMLFVPEYIDEIRDY